MAETRITEDEFLIRVRPVKNEAGEYTGQAIFSVISSHPLIDTVDKIYSVHVLSYVDPLLK